MHLDGEHKFCTSFARSTAYFIGKIQVESAHFLRQCTPKEMVFMRSTKRLSCSTTSKQGSHWMSFTRFDRAPKAEIY